MNKYILVRYSELILKKKQKHDFASFLINTLKSKFDSSNLSYSIIKKHDYFLIEILNNNKINSFFEILKKTSGLSFFVETIVCEEDKIEILKYLKKIIDKKNNFTFRITVKDVSKKIFPKSIDLINFASKYILENYESTVSLKENDLNINIYITSEKKVLIYLEQSKINGIKGLPSGTSGKILTLLSGGIDSPVAAYKLITRGTRSSFITFLTESTGNIDTLSKINKIAEKINEFNNIDSYLYLVNFSKIQSFIKKHKDENYRVIILRRMYLRFAEKILKKYNYKALVTGDSLGQVASQTLDSLFVTNNAINSLLLRPLVGMNKEEIINIATKINTLDLSNLKGEDMCATFTPKKPIIFPVLDKTMEIEQDLKKYDNILNEILENDIRKIRLGKK